MTSDVSCLNFWTWRGREEKDREKERARVSEALKQKTLASMLAVLASNIVFLEKQAKKKSFRELSNRRLIHLYAYAKLDLVKQNSLNAQCDLYQKVSVTNNHIFCF